MTTHKKRNSIVVFAIIGAIAMAGAAYAYWTAGGSGTGSATTGTNAALTANQTSVIDNLYPDGPVKPISGNFDEHQLPGPPYVESVTVTVASVQKSRGERRRLRRDGLRDR